MRRDSDQAATALQEQARAMKEAAGLTANIGEQIRLVSTANTEHSSTAGRVVARLKSIRAVSEQNTEGVLESRGTTGELIEHAEALRSGVSRNAPRNGRVKAARPNGRG
jgi:methyl-accepting chemotaxis protein